MSTKDGQLALRVKFNSSGENCSRARVVNGEEKKSQSGPQEVRGDRAEFASGEAPEAREGQGVEDEAGEVIPAGEVNEV